MIRLQGLWKKATQQAVRVNIQEPITQLLYMLIRADGRKYPKVYNYRVSLNRLPSL